MMLLPEKKLKKPKPKKPAHHTAAANEYADLPEDQQKALHERIREASAPKKDQAQDVGAVTSSIVTALTQALHTNDKTMLDDILRDTITSSISVTIKRMDAGLALELLGKCAAIFQKQPARAPEVLPWIKECLNVHAVFLMSQPDISIMLAPVQLVIKEHLATFDKLLLLQGRLELLMSRQPAHREVSLNPHPLSRFLEETSALPNVEAMAITDDDASEESSGEDEDDTSADEEPNEAAANGTLDAEEEDEEEEDEESEGDEDMDEDEY